MFTNVIVGITGDHPNTKVVAAARAVARGAELHLAYVYADVDEPIGPDDHYRRALRNDALAVLEAAAAGAGEIHAHAVRSYSASRGLKRLAGELHADLIVLGAASHGPLGRLVLGDVSRTVLHGAPCPVLTVARSGAQTVAPKRIGVAYDRSEEAKVALELALGIARDHGSSLEIVTVVDVGIIPAVWSFGVDAFLEQIEQPEAEEVARLVAGLDIPAEGHAIRGSVTTVLTELSSRVDLMVCGSRSWGAPRRVAMGSSADRLLHEAHCPVIIAPRGARVPHEAADPSVAMQTGAAR